MASVSEGELSAPSSQFLYQLMKRHGIKRQQRWQNHNGTVHQTAYILDIKDLKSVPADILKSVFEHNKSCTGRPIKVVPVAGWDDQHRVPKCCTSILGIPCKKFRRVRELQEYSESYSLSTLTTASGADIILRVKRSAQRMKLIKRSEQQYLRVTPGVRITDADQFLAKRGFALPPNMPTLHVGSIVGTAANGCYGPGRDHGSMTTNIVEMKIVTATGKKLTLSSTENKDLFCSLKDFHMGAGFFVRELTFGNIEPRFPMKRKDIFCKRADGLRETLATDTLHTHEHFIAMYIPVDIKSEDNFFPRIRITTFDRVTNPGVQVLSKSNRTELFEFLKYLKTELGEPIINMISDHEKLQKLFPLILEAAVKSTYGSPDDAEKVDWSADVLHLFSSYTDLPIHDLNWLIQVDSPEQASELLADLLELVEGKLKDFAEKGCYPLFNAFARYLKGMHFDDEELHGLAPTAVQHNNQSVLSFELLTFSSLSETENFKELRDSVIQTLRNQNHRFSYHPGKSFPENIHHITELFDPELQGRGLAVFREAIEKLHEGSENIPYSPLLTTQKMDMIYS